jgi:hypothetical protein
VFQDPLFQRSLANVSSLAEELVAVVCSVPQQPCLQEQYRPAIENSLRTVSKLAAEMKCQRGRFRLDDSVHVDMLYNEDTMHDVRVNEMEADTEVRVIAVLSRGWISIPPKETDSVEQLICKTRVLIEVDD